MKAFKYKLEPNKTQEAALDRTLVTCRYLYNAALGERIDQYKADKKSVTYFQQAYALSDKKNEWQEQGSSKTIVPYFLTNEADVLCRKSSRCLRILRCTLATLIRCLFLRFDLSQFLLRLDQRHCALPFAENIFDPSMARAGVVIVASGNSVRPVGGSPITS